MDIGARFTIGAGVTGQEQLDRLNASAREFGKVGQTSAGQFNAAMRGLPAQFTDIATSLQGGQSPLTVLLQQGGQIKDQFGGIGAAARGLGQYIAGLANPVTLLAVATVGLGIAAFKGASEQQALRDQLILNGNAAGMTMSRFDALAAGVQKATGVTVGAARELAAAAAATGAFDPRSIEAATSAMARLQQLTGASSEAIAKDFAGMSRGVASWAAEHNKSYNYLSAAQFAYIRQLEQQGRTEEAIRINAELLDKALAGRTRQLGFLERGWEGVKGAASRAWDAMLNIGREDSTATKIKDLQAKLAIKLQQGQLNSVPAVQASYDKGVRALVAEIAALQDKLDLEEKVADAEAKRARTEQEKIDKLNSGGADREAAARLAVELQQLQNASAARIALQEQQKARLDGLKRAELIDDAAYAARKVEIEREILAEQARLVEAEIAIENRKPANNTEQKLARQQRVLALQQKLADIASKGVIAGFDAEFIKPADKKQISEFETALSGLGAQAEKLRFQGQYITEFGERAASAAEVMARFETTSGKFRDLTDTQKAAYIEAARAVDELTASLQRQQAGLSYEKQTTEIERQTAALGQSAFQRKVNADLQALENAGIKEGTELYTRLAEQRIAALTASEEASRKWSTGIQEGLSAYVESATNNAALARDALTNAFKGAEDALVGFVTKGKLDFKGFVNSVIADLARIQIRKMLAESATSSEGIIKGLIGLAGSFFGGGGYTGAGSTGLGFANGGAGDYSSANMSQVFGTRASGGRVEPYATYRVNESGVETLTMGSQGGYILNAAQTQQAQRAGADVGKSIVVNFNQSNTIGSNVSRGEISAALARAKESGKAELMEALRRNGAIA